MTSGSNGSRRSGGSRSQRTPRSGLGSTTSSRRRSNTYASGTRLSGPVGTGTPGGNMSGGSAGGVGVFMQAPMGPARSMGSRSGRRSGSLSRQSRQPSSRTKRSSYRSRSNTPRSRQSGSRGYRSNHSSGRRSGTRQYQTPRAGSRQSTPKIGPSNPSYQGTPRQAPFSPPQGSAIPPDVSKALSGSSYRGSTRKSGSRRSRRLSQKSVAASNRSGMIGIPESTRSRHTIGGKSLGGASRVTAATTLTQQSTTSAKPMRKSYYLFEQAEDGNYKQHDLETTVGEELVSYYRWENQRRERQALLEEEPDNKGTTVDLIMKAFNQRFSIWEGAQSDMHASFLRNKYFKITDNAPDNTFRTTSPEEVQEIYDEYRALMQHILKIPEVERTRHYDANAVANGMIMASKVVAIRKGYKQPLAFGHCWLENSEQKMLVDDPSVQNNTYNWFIDENQTIWFVDAVRGVDIKAPPQQSGCEDRIPNGENKAVCVFLY